MKQFIIVVDELKLPKGKLCSQVCHASICSYKLSSSTNISKWEILGCAKIILKVKSKQDLLDLQGMINGIEIKTYLVADAGKTIIPSGTITCMGVEISDNEKLDNILDKLKLL